MIKTIISNVLCGSFVGRIIYRISGGKIVNVRHRDFVFNVPVKYCSYRIVASIFWGFYEAAETRLIRKHLRSDVPVIELGSSLGVVSSFAINKLNKDAMFVGVEANKKIFQTIETNLQKNNIRSCSYRILNKAISYSDSFMFLHTTANSTESYLTKTQVNAANDLPVECTRLIDIVRQFGLQDFTLISDIEGSEVGILLNDNEALKNCSAMIIELHDSEFNGRLYRVQDVAGIIRDSGFRLEERDGNVFYFSKTAVV